MTDLERHLLDALAEIIAADILRRRERRSAEGETA
jgi:hypothetical protein